MHTTEDTIFIKYLVFKVHKKKRGTGASVCSFKDICCFLLKAIERIKIYHLRAVIDTTFKRYRSNF